MTHRRRACLSPLSRALFDKRKRVLSRIKSIDLTLSILKRRIHFIEENEEVTFRYVTESSFYRTPSGKIKIDEPKKVKSWTTRKAEQRRRELSKGYMPTIPEQREMLLVTESDVADSFQGAGQIHPDTSEQHENLEDVGGQQTAVGNPGTASAVNTGQKEKLPLQEFFERPVRVYYNKVNGTIDDAFRPWDAWSLDATVRSKLRNYAYFRGTLHLRFALSGTPYHFGRLLVSYQPYDGVNDTLFYYDLLNSSTTPGYAKTKSMYCNYLSQSPGVIYLDPKDNEPVDMAIPFIHHKPMARLFNKQSTAIADSDSFEDLYKMGQLRIVSLNNIVYGAAGTGPDPFLTVYAWVSDIELGTTTGTVMQITTESDFTPHEEDERKSGPIETIASAVANVSAHLMAVPVISKFATASWIGSTAVSKVAALFGWSKPPLLAPPGYMKNAPYQNGAHTIGTDTNLRITLDPKQELTVDGSVCGSSEDEMTITHITSRESYYTTLSWTKTTSPISGVLLSQGITPMVSTYMVQGTQQYYQPTALAYAAKPFGYWRGVIKFRFDIVCNHFHRGKLLFWFDPNVAQLGLIAVQDELNKKYSKIIDIQETQTVEMCIEWAFPRPWARNFPENQNTAAIGVYNQDEVSYSYSQASTLDCFNGFIRVKPFNFLQAPTDDPVLINCFVSAEEMEFNRYTPLNMPNSRRVIFTESLFTESSFSSSAPPTSQDPTCLALNESTADTQNIALTNFGERVVSFRQLLKRYVSTRAKYDTSTAAAGANQVFTIKAPNIPNIKQPYSLSSAVELEHDLFSYLRYSYLGIRGGVKKRIQLVTSSHQESNDSVMITLDNDTNLIAPSDTFSDSTLAADFASSKLIQSNINGSVHFYPTTNGGVEFEVPFYSVNLYHYSFSTDFGAADLSVSDVNNFCPYWCKNYTAQFFAKSNGPSAMLYNEDCAAGEDFTFMRFQGAPFWSGTITG